MIRDLGGKVAEEIFDVFCLRVVIRVRVYGVLIACCTSKGKRSDGTLMVHGTLGQVKGQMVTLIAWYPGAGQRSGRAVGCLVP